MNYILIGKIVNTHGIKGEVKILSYSDFDSERYQKGNTVYLLHDHTYLPFQVATFRMHKGVPLVSFHSFQEINLIEPYKNCNVYINESDRKPLKDGRYYRDQLEGLAVIDETGMVIGKSIGIEETRGAQNNLRIEKNDGIQFLLPFIPEFILDVDCEKKTIRIHMEEGLL